MLVLRLSHWDNWDGFFGFYFLSKMKSVAMIEIPAGSGALGGGKTRELPRKGKNAIFFQPSKLLGTPG